MPEHNPLHRATPLPIVDKKIAQHPRLSFRKGCCAATRFHRAPPGFCGPITAPVTVEIHPILIETARGDSTHITGLKTAPTAGHQLLAVRIGRWHNLHGKCRRDDFWMFSEVINRRVGQQNRVPLRAAVDATDKGDTRWASTKGITFDGQTAG